MRGEASLDVTLVARIKLGPLYRGLKRLGWSQKEFAKRLGKSQHAVYSWLNLRNIPRISDDPSRANPNAYVLTDEQVAVIEYVAGIPIEEIWPPECRNKDFLDGPRVFEASAKIDVRRLAYASGVNQLESPMDIMNRHDRERILEEIIDSLPERYAMVVRLRMDGKTLEETGEVMGVTRARIIQIETNARNMMRMRNKKKWKEYMDLLEQ